MLTQRVITAAVGIPVIILLILIGGIPYTAVAAALLALAALEFYAVTDPRPAADLSGRPFYRPRTVAVLGATGVVFVTFMAWWNLDQLTGALAISTAGLFAYLMLRGDPEVRLQDWFWAVAGLAYVGFFGAHLVLLRELDDGWKWVSLAVFATFIADTLAYFVGRSMGTTRIAPAVSPGKTLEGTVAGFIGGFVAVLLLALLLDVDMSTGQAVVLGTLLPIAALLGDLSESLIKRGAGVKDTGELLPGHGGFLDRIDAVLFTTPLVYYFVIWAVL